MRSRWWRGSSSSRRRRRRSGELEVPPRGLDVFMAAAEKCGSFVSVSAQRANRLVNRRVSEQRRPLDFIFFSFSFFTFMSYRLFYLFFRPSTLALPPIKGAGGSEPDGGVVCVGRFTS